MFRLPPRQYFLIICLTLYGFALWGASQLFSGMHIDEGFQIQLSSQPFEEIVLLLTQDAHPPLYSLLLSSWFNLVGSGIERARELSILFSLTSSALLYFLLRLKLSRSYSFVGTVIYSSFPMVLMYGVVARNYALLLLLINLTLFVHFTLWSKQKSKADWMVLLAVQVLLLYTHNLSLILLTVGYGVLLLCRLKKFQMLFYGSSFLASITLFLPWIFVIQSQLETKTTQGSWLEFYPISDLQNFGYVIAPVFSTPIMYVGFVFAGLIYLLCTKVWSKSISPHAKTIALYTGLLIATMYGLSFIAPLLFFRYLIILLPLVGYLLGHSLQSFGYVKSVLIGFVIVVMNLLFFNQAQLFFKTSEFIDIQEGLISRTDITTIVDEPMYFFQLEILGYEQLFIYDLERESDVWQGSVLIEPQDYLIPAQLQADLVQYIGFDSDSGYEDWFFAQKYQEVGRRRFRKYDVVMFERFD